MEVACSAVVALFWVQLHNWAHYSRSPVVTLPVLFMNTKVIRQCFAVHDFSPPFKTAIISDPSNYCPPGSELSSIRLELHFRFDCHSRKLALSLQRFRVCLKAQVPHLPS